MRMLQQNFVLALSMAAAFGVVYCALGWSDAAKRTKSPSCAVTVSFAQPRPVILTIFERKCGVLCEARLFAAFPHEA